LFILSVRYDKLHNMNWAIQKIRHKDRHFSRSMLADIGIHTGLKYNAHGSVYSSI